MSMVGIARADRKTKRLVQRLRPGEIAVISHPDLDELAAEDLIQARVRAVLNAAPSITGRYPNGGPLRLLDAGIPLLDQVGEAVLEAVGEERRVTLNAAGEVQVEGVLVGQGRWLTRDDVTAAMEAARANLEAEIDRFIENTLSFARREKPLVLQPLRYSPPKTRLAGRHVVVVVRGRSYRDDLAAIRSYIDEVNPVLIAVDGAADALLEAGWCPHLIVGDMDSISDRALQCGAELYVHAYPDGRAPGAERLERLGLEGKLIPAPGTSEDVALLLAYQEGARLIVAVGAHADMIDFLEKGRPGMASTLLVRLKVGPRLIDARGVSQLYRGQPTSRYGLQVAVAALVPLVLVAGLSDLLRHWTLLLWLQLRIALGL